MEILRTPTMGETETPLNFTVPPTPLLKKLGYGTGVSVYHLDRSPANGKLRSPWALKKVNREHQGDDCYGQRIQDEAAILKKLDHPNIIGFRGYSVTEDGREVLAMEECTQSLGDMVEERSEEESGPFAALHILKVALSVARALDYLHSEKHLLHGDIKSYNILINNNFGSVKLCDFGVSLSLNNEGVVSSDNDDGPPEYIGTNCWSAPEVLFEGPITARSDIFSLGLVLWEMITLRPPHLDCQDQSAVDADSTVELASCMEKFGERPPLPAVPPSDDYALVIELFIWCTEQDYKARPTAKQIVDKLAASDIE